MARQRQDQEYHQKEVVSDQVNYPIPVGNHSTLEHHAVPAFALLEKNPHVELEPVPFPLMDATVVQEGHETPSLGRHRKKRTPRFFAICAAVILIIVVAVVVGGYLGSRAAASSQNSTSQSPTTVSTSITTSPAQTLTGTATSASQTPSWNIRPGSPLAVVAGNAWDPTSISNDATRYSVFYQTAIGHLALAVRREGDFVTNPHILTDQLNGTGLAVLNYPNMTGNQYSTMYIGDSSKSIREKRQELTNNYWNLGPLTTQRIPIMGMGQNLSLAAVYLNSSTGMRLFYHASNASSNWVQEMTWSSNNGWKAAGTLVGLSNSGHLSAVYEESSSNIRLFYAMGTSIKEVYLNMAEPGGYYRAGITLPDILPDPTASFTAVTNGNSTWLYYATGTGSNIVVNEQALSGTTISGTSIVVARPSLGVAGVRNDTLSSQINIGAIASDHAITVIYPENGFGTLTAITRNMSASWESPMLKESIPLASTGGF